jgi:hypothetical protein
MSVQFVSPCDGWPPLHFIDEGGGAKREIKERLQCWLLGRPLVRRCPSGRIEEESHYVVVEAVVWPSETVHLGRPAPHPSSLVLTQPA